MPEGILRSRFHQFLKAKGKKKITIKRFSKASLNKEYENEELLRSSLLPSSTKTTQVEMILTQGQAWIQDYKDCCFLLKKVSICRQQIRKQNSRKLMSTKQQIHERNIRLLAEEANQNLKKCQKKLKNIEISNSVNPNPHQRKIFTSIIISLADKIRTLTRQLRNDRQKELSHQQQIKQYNRSQFDQQIKRLSQFTEEDWLEENLSEQFERNLMQERNEQIMKIVKSIHYLNSIYKDLEDLVIHQGSLLDRIDQNIEMTLENVKIATKNLSQVPFQVTKAEQIQKNSCSKKVIYVLLFLIFVFFVMFMIKHR